MKEEAMMQNEEPIRDLYIPADLRAWYAKSELAELILETIQQIPDLPPPTETFDGFSSRMLLTLTTYCYATGVHSSQDIELEIKRDPMAQYLCARTFPGWNTLRLFRRRYARQIQRILAELFNRAARTRWLLFNRERDGETYARWIQFRRSDRWNQEASRRLQQAVFLDCVAMDD